MAVRYPDVASTLMATSTGRETSGPSSPSWTIRSSLRFGARGVRRGIGREGARDIAERGNGAEDLAIGADPGRAAGAGGEGGGKGEWTTATAGDAAGATTDGDAAGAVNVDAIAGTFFNSSNDLTK